jgi:hypothetical protein
MLLNVKEGKRFFSCVSNEWLSDVSLSKVVRDRARIVEDELSHSLGGSQMN